MAAFAFAGAEEDADPDYLLFLRHLRPDGKSYALDLPAFGSRPPVRLKYEPPTPTSEDDYSSDVIQSSPTNPRRKRWCSKAAAEPSGEPSAAMVDDDYRVFLEHARVVNGRVVLELGSLVIHYEVDVVGSGGDKEMEEEEEAVLAFGQEEEQREGPVGPVAIDLDAYGWDWRADSGKGKEDAIEWDWRADSGKRKEDANEWDWRADSGKGKEDANEWDWRADSGKGKEDANEWDWRADSGKGKKDANEWDWRAYSGKGKEEEEDGRRNVAAEGLQKIVKREISSTEDDYMSEHPIHLGSEDGIWPKDIISRSDSDFKRRLLHVLRKPYDRKEYEELLDMATVRTPVVKLKHLRNNSISYPTNELGKSFFDYYPDLAQQIEGSNYRNGLALLRGFFFWLKNMVHEGSFRPWKAASKGYTVLPLKDSDYKL